VTAVLDTPAAEAAPAPRTRRKRRWHRVAIPFAIALVLFGVTGIAHAYEEPDFGDPGTLSPTGTGPDGSSRLAGLLAERNVTVERVTSGLATVRAARGEPATIFIPAPDLANANLVWLLISLRRSHRIVVVEPGILDQTALPVFPAGTRWASRTTTRDCGSPLLAGVGAATVERTRYFALEDATVCYGKSVVIAPVGPTEVVVVGASDPFRNGRIGDHDNARLATALLAGRPRVVWLDLHAEEKVSYSTTTQDDIGIRLPDEDTSTDDGGPPPGPPNPLWTAVPPLLWPVLVQLLVVALAVALWRARRLGPPVPEPLPVAVPAAETVTGRGRLYERADARGPALAALQAAARHRLLPLLDLPRDAAEDDVVAAVAARTRRPTDQIRTVLYGVEPSGDDELLSTVADLDALVTALSRERTSR